MSSDRDAKVKLGSGVVGVEVGTHPSYKGVKCFMLRRSDGTVIDVSYRKCINNLMSSRWVSQTPPLMRLRRISSIMLREKQRARKANNGNQQVCLRPPDIILSNDDQRHPDPSFGDVLRPPHSSVHCNSYSCI